MSKSPVGTRFAFQPLVNLHTGGVVAVELLARPAGSDIDALLAGAARAGRLEHLDVALAAAAVRHSDCVDTWLPLHVNLLADTVVADSIPLTPLHRAVERSGRRPNDVVLDINPSFTELEPPVLLAGLRRLRRRGYRLALDGVGGGNYPLTVIADAAPDLIKMDREIVAGLPEHSGCLAILEALAHLAGRIDSQLVAEGVERPDQLDVLRRCGVTMAQGNLLGPPGSEPPSWVTETGVSMLRVPTYPLVTQAAPGTRICDYLHPAPALPTSATAEDVHAVFADNPSVSSVVLVDASGRPCRSVERNRFLLALSGAFGHALHARRSALRLADPPRVIRAACSAVAALDLVRHGDPPRMYDDLVVLGSDDRYAGVVRVGDVLHGMATICAVERISDLVDRKVAMRVAFTLTRISVGRISVGGGNLGIGTVLDRTVPLDRMVSDIARTMPSAHVERLSAQDLVVLCDPPETMRFGVTMLDAVAGSGARLALASLFCPPDQPSAYRELSRLLTRLHQRATAMPHTSWLFGRPASGRRDRARQRVEFEFASV